MLGEGRDEGADGDGARFGKEARDFADAANVLIAVCRREAEVAAEAAVAADVVSVEAIAEYALGGGKNNDSVCEVYSVEIVTGVLIYYLCSTLTLATRYSSSANAIVVLPAPDSPVNHTVQPTKSFLLPRPST